jgi:hypothetical protein
VSIRHLCYTKWNQGNLAMGKTIQMSLRLDRVLLDQIAGRWQLLILDALCDHGRKARFNALKRAIPGISQKTLAEIRNCLGVTPTIRLK